MAKKEFTDSVEATEFMEKLHTMINDPRLLDWAEQTDDNFYALTEQKLLCAREPYNAFMVEMYGAGEGE